MDATADTDTAATDAAAGAQPPSAADGRESSTDIVAREDDQDVRSEIEQPAKLMRIATTVQTLFEEVKTTELDEAARQRLTDIHNRIVDDLRELVSSNLEDELETLALEQEDGPPSGSELRVMQAQLAGWLQGVFHGIQASVASQQMAAQHQLAQMQKQASEAPGPRSGQYL